MFPPHSVQTAFYMSVGCISYAGFGNAAPGNLVTGELFDCPSASVKLL